MTEPFSRRPPVSEMWFAADETVIIHIDTQHGPILAHTLPGLAAVARFGNAAIGAPHDGEILRFTALQGGHACGDTELCDQDPTPPVLHSYRLVIQESDDHGETWK